MQTPLPEWLTTSEAGKLVGRSAGHISSLVKSGKITGKRWGATWMVERDSLLEYFRNPPRPGPKGPIKPREEEQPSQ
jgi:excisionase family DNA binding protein